MKNVIFIVAMFVGFLFLLEFNVVSKKRGWSFTIYLLNIKRAFCCDCRSGTGAT